MSCSCDRSITPKAVGQCQKDTSKIEDTGRSYVCYVREPSNCKDLTYSIYEQGRKLSSEACNNGKYLKLSNNIQFKDTVVEKKE